MSCLPYFILAYSYILHLALLQLEINLAKKDEQLAAKDQQINTLEAAVQGQVFRGVDIATPLLKRSGSGKKHLVATPNQVSDVSGDADSEESLGWSRSSLSQISKVNSSEDDSSPKAKDDGRWNIPFYPSFDNSVVGISEIMSPRHEHALKDIAFIPIGATEMERRLSGDTAVTIRRPVAVRKSLGNMQNKIDKENRSPKTKSRHSIDSVGAPFSIR